MATLLASMTMKRSCLGSLEEGVWSGLSPLWQPPSPSGSALKGLSMQVWCLSSLKFCLRLLPGMGAVCDAFGVLDRRSRLAIMSDLCRGSLPLRCCCLTTGA